MATDKKLKIVDNYLTIRYSGQDPTNGREVNAPYRAVWFKTPNTVTEKGDATVVQFFMGNEAITEKIPWGEFLDITDTKFGSFDLLVSWLRQNTGGELIG